MEQVVLGGMALENGVLVQGPTSWAAAIRTDDGSLRTASGRVPRFATRIVLPLVRGPVRLAESLAVLPAVRRELPDARLAFERPVVLVGLAVGAATAAAICRSPLSPGVREVLAAFASLAPAVVSLRGGDLAGYHGAEHVSIGSYESGTDAPKEHDRCGSHLVGPLLASSALVGLATARAPVRVRGAARVAGSVVAVGVSLELFGWMGRNPTSRLTRVLRRPGHELQARLSTREPTGAQLEVARAALQACLAAEARR